MATISRKRTVQPNGTSEPAQAALPPCAGQAAASHPAVSRYLQAYEAAYEALAAPAAQPDPPAAVLALLLARDGVAAWLRTGPPDAPQALCIAALDDAVRGRADELADAAGEAALAQWRRSLAADASQWWWRLDEEGGRRQPGRAALLRLLLFASFILALDLLLRLWGRAGSFFTIFGFLLTLATATTLSGWGRTLARRLFQGGAAARARRRQLIAAAALLLLVAVLRTTVPGAAARLYYLQAQAAHTGGVATGPGDRRAAVAGYQRAAALCPNLAQAHYQLGVLHEELFDFDRAQADYGAALAADANFAPAANNLARLLALYGGQPAGAVALLDAAEEQLAAARAAPPGAALAASALPRRLDCFFRPARRDDLASDALLYAVRTNRAAALLQLGHLSQARAAVDAALALRPEGRRAHCVLAQLIEAESSAAENSAAQGGAVDEALAAWRTCFRSSADGEPVDPAWLLLAKERLDAEQ